MALWKCRLRTSSGSLWASSTVVGDDQTKWIIKGNISKRSKSCNSQPSDLIISSVKKIFSVILITKFLYYEMLCMFLLFPKGRWGIRSSDSEVSSVPAKCLLIQNTKCWLIFFSPFISKPHRETISLLHKSSGRGDTNLCSPGLFILPFIHMCTTVSGFVTVLQTQHTI